MFKKICHTVKSRRWTQTSRWMVHDYLPHQLWFWSSSCFENGEITNILNAGTQFQGYDLNPARPKSKIFQNFGSTFQNFKFGSHVIASHRTGKLFGLFCLNTQSHGTNLCRPVVPASLSVFFFFHYLQNRLRGRHSRLSTPVATATRLLAGRPKNFTPSDVWLTVRRNFVWIRKTN